MKALLTWSIPLCRVAGIPVLIHWSWFLVAYWVIVHPIIPNAFGWGGWYVLEYTSLFALVLVHELGHAFACRSVGGTVEHVVLWPLGGLALVKPPPRPGAALWTAAAGPLVNLLLAPLLFGLLQGAARSRGAQPDVFQFLLHILALNIVLLVFNLLPIYPLDGGQMLQAILWIFLGRGRSLVVVSWIGVVAGVALMAYGHGFGLIGVFIALSAAAGLLRADHLSRPGVAPLLDSMAHLENGQYAEARANCTEAIATIENNPGALATAHLLRGAAALAAGDLDAALADEIEALRLVPSADGHLACGLVRLARDERADAAGDLAEVIALRPEQPAAYCFRGILRLREGKHEAAIADSSAAIHRDSRDILAYLTRAHARSQSGDLSADADFAAALALDAPYVQRVFVDGSLKLEVADYAEAMSWKPHHIYGRLGALANQRKSGDPAATRQTEEAIQRNVTLWFIRLMDLLLWVRPGSTSLRRSRAQMYVELGEWEKALTDLETALAREPNNERTLNNLAWALAVHPDPKARDGPRAHEYARQACELTSWTKAQILDTYAATCAATGDFGEAIKWQNVALESAEFRKKSENGARERLRLYEQGQPYHNRT